MSSGPGHDGEPDGTDELSVVRPDTLSRAGIVDEAPSTPVYVASARDGVPIINEKLCVFGRL